MTMQPGSVAIAGAWGYIGRRILDAALAQGIQTYVYDPGPVPDDLAGAACTRLTSEAAFYELEVDLFHLALHPEARRQGIAQLLRRGATEPLLILNEKPIVSPGARAEARNLIEAVDRSQATMLFHFPELFDPLTEQITRFLRRFRHLEITGIDTERSKDREDPAIPRNFKRMVSIQYQESVHCLAYVLHLLSVLPGHADRVLDQGLVARARSEPYLPPNPEAYPETVDGRCEFRLSLGSLQVNGLTDFKRGARWAKRRVVRGIGDGRPFVIEADYLEGRKWLRIDGIDQPWDPRASSYEAVLATIARWRATVPAEELRTGPYPNARLAWRAFQLSELLWTASHRRARIELPSLRALDAFDPCAPHS